MSYHASPQRSASSHSVISSFHENSWTGHNDRYRGSRIDTQPLPAHTTFYATSLGSISYRLNVNYRRKVLDDVVLLSAYVNDREFDLHSTDVPEDKKHTSTASEHTSRAFEIVTEAFVEDPEAHIAPPKGSTDFTSEELTKHVGLLHLTKVCPTHLVIHSWLLREALGLIIRYYPGELWILDPSEPAVIFEPYGVLFHHYREIEDFVSRKSNANPEECDSRTQTGRVEVVRDMAVLLDFLKPKYESQVKAIEYSLAQDVPMISFDMLWYLYRPGADVWVQDTANVYMAVVHRFVHERDRDELRWSSNLYSGLSILHLWCLDTDGNRVARTRRYHFVTRFTGQVKVASLSVCPVRYWDASDQGARRQNILDRSRLLVEACREGSLHVRYHDPNNTSDVIPGKMVVDYLRPPSDHPQLTEVLNPRFDESQNRDPFDPALENHDYIFLNDAELTKAQDDIKTAPPYVATEHQSGAPQSRTQFGSDRATVGGGRPRSESVIEVTGADPQKKALLGSSQITDHQILLLPTRVPAFSLNNKRWHVINTAYMSKVEPSEDSINNLVIPEAALKTIRALASRRDRNTTKTSWSADFIEGKGIGQIILLHGPPGVGKTYTVEAVSEWLKRPFLALTVADLGTVETSIEQQLTTWFDLAEAWNAVLLVDEADIFLEQRKNRDLYRNGLVTAFLRRMEYFKGLLFLTTNRVGQIDDAFISRVHVAIEYPPLTHEYRVRIWKAFFAKLHAERKGKIKVSPRAQAYVLGKEMDLNGREIRNALQTAIALAEYETRQAEGDDVGDEVVTVEQGHLEDVLGMCQRFHIYVGSIRREDEKKRASGRGDRNDYGD